MLRTVPPSRVLGVCSLIVAVGCAPSAPPDAPTAPDVQSFVRSWGEIEVEGAVEVPDSGPAWEVRFDGGGLEGVTWEAVQGIDDLRVEDGRLVGTTSSSQPLVLLELPEPAGGDDDLWSVSISVRASAGSRVAAHPVLEPGPPMEVNVARVEEFPISSALVPGDDVSRYRIVLDHVFLIEMMPATRSPRRILVRPTDAADAEFALESIRLEFRREYLASIDSGPGWHGLGEVFRETLVSRTPETLVFETTLPERPWLHLAAGSVESTPPSFRVAVERAGEPAETVMEIRPEATEQWQQERIDLGAWAGESVRIRLQAEAEDGSEGRLAFWGAPTVRSAVDGSETKPQAVIVFLADTLRRDHLDAWGYERATAPTLSRIASEGVRFSDAIAQSTWTKVSVSSILTSLYPSTSGIAGLSDRLSAGETTLAEVFRDAGYATFATSSVPFSGQLTNLHQGVEVMWEYGAVPDDLGQVHPVKNAAFWVDTFTDWLDLHRDVPVFALVHVMDPHSPFEPAAPFDTEWATAEEAEVFAEQSERVSPFIQSPLWKRFNAPTAAELDQAGVDAASFVRHEKNWYDGSILAMDGQFARMMGKVDELGLGDSTLLAVVSDHGEEFLEHGLHWHGTTVYGELTNVPLIFWGQGVPAGVVVDQTVQTIDLYPTLLDLAGLPTTERAQGTSLVPTFGEGGVGGGPRAVFTQLPGMRPGEPDRFAVIEEGWKLVWNRDPPEGMPEHELFDHEADPLNLQNVAAEHPDIVDRLAATLARWETWATEQRLDDEAAQAEMSAEELEQLRSLGYVN